MRRRTFFGPSGARRFFFSWESSRNRGGPGSAGIFDRASGFPDRHPGCRSGGGRSARPTHRRCLAGDARRSPGRRDRGGGRVGFRPGVPGNRGAGVRYSRNGGELCRGACIAVLAGARAGPSGAEKLSLRSLEVLRLDCKRHRGTGCHFVRQRYHPGSVRLGARSHHASPELDPDQFAGYLRRFEAIDLSEVPRQRSGVTGIGSRSAI